MLIKLTEENVEDDKKILLKIFDTIPIKNLFGITEILDNCCCSEEQKQLILNKIKTNSFIKLLNLNDEETLEFNTEKFAGTYETGNLQDFENLLCGMMEIDKNNRLNMEAVVTNKFFRGSTEYRDKIRIFSGCSPTPQLSDELIKIIDNEFRNISMKTIFKHYYNIKTNISWFKYDILFHIIEMYDRLNYYISKEQNKEEFDKLLLNINCKDNFIFMCILYINYKLFISYDRGLDIYNLTEQIFKQKSEELKNIELDLFKKFEIFLIEKVFDRELFKKSLYEYLIERKSGVATEEEIVNLFRKYIKVKENFRISVFL